MSKNNVARTIGFTAFATRMLLKQMVLQHFQNNVAETNVFTTFPKLMLLKPMVLQHFQKEGC